MADPGITNKWVWHLRSREGPRNPPDEFEYLRDIQAYLLAIEMKGIYAGLVEVETKCTEIDQGNSSNTESNPDLSAEQWEDLGTLQRTLLDKHNDFYFASSPLRPQLHQFKKLAYDHSFHSRPLRRFSDRLLPLLRREQDLETSRRWLDVMKLTSSLIQILSDEYYYYEEVAFLDAFEQIEAILERLMLWFRNKYDSLNYNKDETEEQDLCEPTFEFPNNIRYICTTMPWTIRPALLVLWGVCWMFIIGSGGTEQEKLTAVDPITSPLPNTYNLQGDLPSIIGAGLQTSAVNEFDSTVDLSQIIMDSFLNEDTGMINVLNGPLDSLQTIPQTLNFLATDFGWRGIAENSEFARQEPDEAAGLSCAAVIRIPVTRSQISSGENSSMISTSDADFADHHDRESNPNQYSEGQKSQPRFSCPDCGKTYTRLSSLKRHQSEAPFHAESSSKGLFPCPYTNCKRAIGKSPFQRNDRLKRHLETCKHHNRVSSSREESTSSRSSSALTPTLADALQCQDPGPEEAVNANGTRKRARSESDEVLSDDSFKKEIMKKRKSKAKEVEEKKAVYLQSLKELESIDNTIHVFYGSGPDS